MYAFRKEHYYLPETMIIQSPTFDYRNAPIIIEDGAWIGAKTVVCPGIKVKSHAILTVGSTATKNMKHTEFIKEIPH